MPSLRRSGWRPAPYMSLPWPSTQSNIALTRAILDAGNVVGYFNFVTRLAHGLGVDVEEFWPEDDVL